MNPALPLLVLLAAGGGWLLWRRDPRSAVAWAGIGIAACLLLAPALRLADGIPSPAASLAAHAPWQQVADPADGNPVLRDVTFQIQPWLLFLRQELRAGRLPQWNPHQFAGAPFWANGQSAPLFPLHLVFVVLPVQLGLVLLPWLRFVIAGLGVWLLARRLGLDPPGALAAALVFPLSGMLVSFLLFPMGNALALVPWVLWAVDRLAAGESGPLPLAVAAGLQALGGHPETVIHTALLATVFLLVRGVEPGWRAVGLRFAGGWLLAGALAAIHWLPLAFNVLQSSKWEGANTGAALSLPEIGSQLLRLVLPQLYGHPAEGTWWGPFNYSATAVYLGVLALPLIAMGLGGLGGLGGPDGPSGRRWRAVATVTGLSLLIAYHLPVLYDLVLRVPLLGRVAHHRLIFGVELGGALLLGRGLDRWRRGEGTRGALAGAALLGVMLAAAWLAFGDEWAQRGLTGEQMRWTLWAAGLAGAFALSLRMAPATRRRVVWGLPALLVVDLLVAHVGINPGLSRARLYPETPAIGILQAGTAEAGMRVVGVGQALRPNAAMVYGLYDLRGDDPVKAARFEALYRRLSSSSAVFFEPVTRWDEALLDELSVRWVVGPPGVPPPEPGWRRIDHGPDAQIWERPGALPVVRWNGAGERRPMPRVAVREPGRWEIELEEVTSAAGGELVIGEVWDPGWRAWTEDAPAEVKRTDDELLRIAVPVGARRVELRYRAPGLIAGALVTLVGLVWVVGLALTPRRGGAGG